MRVLRILIAAAYQPRFDGMFVAVMAVVIAALPAYLVGIVLAGGAAQDHHWIRRLRTLTVGCLTPFCFLRAGMLVSASAVIAAPAVALALFGAKVGAKIFGLYPVVGRFRRERQERWYYSLMMSTGLTFGTISALYGFSHGIVTQSQHSYLVAVVIGTAVIPSVIAGLAFVPRHLLPTSQTEAPSAAAAAGAQSPRSRGRTCRCCRQRA